MHCLTYTFDKLTFKDYHNSIVLSRKKKKKETNEGIFFNDVNVGYCPYHEHKWCVFSNDAFLCEGGVQFSSTSSLCKNEVSC